MAVFSSLWTIWWNEIATNRYQMETYWHVSQRRTEIPEREENRKKVRSKFTDHFLDQKMSRTWGQPHIRSISFTEESVKESPWEQNQNQKIKEIRNASAIQRNNKSRMKTEQEVQKGKNIDKIIVCW